MLRLFWVGVLFWGLIGLMAYGAKRSAAWRWGLRAKNDNRWFFYKNSGLHRRLRLGLVAAAGVFALMVFLTFYFPSKNPVDYGEKLYNVAMSVATGYTITYLFYRFTIYREKLSQDEKVLKAVWFAAKTHVKFEILKKNLQSVACFDPNSITIPLKPCAECDLYQCAFCIAKKCTMKFGVTNTVGEKEEYNVYHDLVLNLKPSMINVFNSIGLILLKRHEVEEGQPNYPLGIAYRSINRVHLFFLAHEGYNCDKEMSMEERQLTLSENCGYLDGEELFTEYIKAYDKYQQQVFNFAKKYPVLSVIS